MKHKYLVIYLTTGSRWETMAHNCREACNKTPWAISECCIMVIKFGVPF